METTKTHWKNKFNYDYLGCYSLENKDLILTIKEFKKESVPNPNGKKSDCFVIYFVENQKPMIVNKTNCKIMTKIFNSPFVEDWVGKRIALYSEKVNAFGEITEGLRIRNINTNHIDWADKLNQCTTVKCIEDLYKKNSVMISGSPEIIELFSNYKAKLVGPVDKQTERRELLIENCKTLAQLEDLQNNQPQWNADLFDNKKETLKIK